MIKSWLKDSPQIATSAYVCETALVIGKVTIGENSGVWPGAVIRGDYGTIRIGSNTYIEDNCVVHSGILSEIGDNVIIGHSVVVHSAKIGNNVLVASHVTLLDDVEVGDGCVIAAGALVRPGQKIPPNSLVVGVPSVIKGEVSPKQRELHGIYLSDYNDLLRQSREMSL